MRVPDEADRDFTASAFIIRDGEILLMNHSKLGLWLQPGGHIEEGETPDEAAKREALEETGVEIEFFENFVSDETLDKTDNCPTPFNVNLHPIREGHYHCDFQFLAKVKQEKKASHSHEHDGLKWFTRQELESEEYEMPPNMVSSGVRAISLVEE